MEGDVSVAGEGGAAVPAAAAVSAAPAPATGAPINKPIPKDLTAMKLLSVTKSFVVVRALVYAVVSGIMLGTCLVVLGLCYVIARWGGSAGSLIALLVVLGSLGAIFGFLKFAQRYCLYMIKAAHVAAITEYLRTGEVPVTESGYQGVLKYGKEMVGKHFGAANIAFVADALISKATRQIMRWVNKAENLLSFVPGAQNVFKIVNFILSTALNFIDEAVLSYIFYHKEEKSSFKKACDGLVYYAQAWKGMLMGAAKTAAFVWILRGACFLIVYGIVIGAGMFVSSGSGALTKVVYIVGVLFALVFTYSLQTIIIEPYATCMMIKDYHIAIAGKPLKADLYGTLCKVSNGFKELFNKSKEPVPETIAGSTGAEAASEPSAAPVTTTASV
ncbi:MAG: hypothetical protein LBC59_06075 [Chitinispirillales bacterium]|jgi:hypothetical protein|nr:hypothetical protein [Chitinispirillales bacterium]